MKKLSLVILLVILLTACSSQNIVNSGEEDIQQVGEIPSITVIPPTIEATIIIPTATYTKTATQKPTITPKPTETVVPTEVVKFDEVRIIGVDTYPNYASIIFEFPEISKLYYVKVNNLAYNCQIPEGTVDRLFCSGEQLRTAEYADVSFFSDDAFENELILMTLYVPAPVPTPLPIGEPSTWCPARGTNITCETEHRVEFGEECWVQTCFDACGYYYSYHTCQLPPNNNFLAP